MGQYLENVYSAYLAGDADQIGQALEELIAETIKKPGDWELLEDLARAYFCMERYKETTAVCEELTGLDPGRPEPLEIAAQAHFFGGEYDAAILKAKRALELNPDSPIAEHVLRHAEKRKEAT